MAEQIARRKIADEVFDRLIDLIRSGEIAPGDALPSERALMERFGVGRPGAREALQRIDMMGLATIRHGERSRLNALTPALALRQTAAIGTLLADDPAMANHMRDARRMMEVGIAAQAAVRVQDDDIVALAALTATQKAAGTDRKAAMDADRQFHLRIAEICANPVMTAALDALIRAIEPAEPDPTDDTAHQSLRAHKRIIGALARSDGPLAAARMEAHLRGDAPQDQLAARTS